MSPIPKNPILHQFLTQNLSSSLKLNLNLSLKLRAMLNLPPPMQKSKDYLICFDLDGVLISSMVTANEIFYRVISDELGLPLHDYPTDKKLMSMSAEERVQLLWSHEIQEKGIQPPQIERVLQLYRKEKLEAGMPLLPYAKEALALMSEHFESIACVSSNPDQVIQDFLAKLGIMHYFSKITGIDFIPRSKPDPEIYISTIDYFVLEPSHCLTFEDSTAGVASAKGAGMKVIGVATGLESVEDLKKAGANLVWKDFSEMELGKVKGVLG